MTGNSNPGRLAALRRFGLYVLFAAAATVLLPAGSNPGAKAQVAAEQEICNLVKTYCRKIDGVRINDAICRSARKQKRTYGYTCGKKHQRNTVGPQACRSTVEHGKNGLISLSIDAKNPRIFAYCIKGTGSAARQCAYEACTAKGGRSCGLPCNPNTGNVLRACNVNTITIVVANDFTRLGCGERYVRNGNHTFESYVNRELNRCRRTSKLPHTCRLEASWR